MSTFFMIAICLLSIMQIVAVTMILRLSGIFHFFEISESERDEISKNVYDDSST